MPIRLSDDGTLDTVLKCSDCGEEFRYNYNDDDEPRGEDSSAAYDRFVAWAIEDATGEHECEGLPACAASMGCLCAGHARGNSASEACDTTE